MDLDKPLDLSPGSRALDYSGTPAGFIELLRKRRQLLVLEEIEDRDVSIEFPMGDLWRERTGCARFVRLKSARNGKSHALVRRERMSATRSDAARTSLYPELDTTGERRDERGAGVLAYLTADQLHPPMVADEALWRDGHRWGEAARVHTVEAARFARLRRGETVLDIGCGTGGPARTLVDELDASVYGVALDPQMVRTGMRHNSEEARWTDRIELVVHDCQQPYARTGFDLAWSMNMLYQVLDHQAMLTCAHEALRGRGRLFVEDWMLTPRVTCDDVEALEHNFGAPGYQLNFARVVEYEQALTAAGFRIESWSDLAPGCSEHMARHFEPEFNRCFRPQLVADDPQHGGESADQFVAAVKTTIRLYESGALGYMRVLAGRF
jgi:cyclopropane fatty-acyl-phospholipid synthase-like methyltransferase